MNLYYELLEDKIEMHPGQICCLTIENTQEFRSVIKDVLGPKERISFFNMDKQVPEKEINIIDNVYHLNLNDRQLMNRILKELETRMFEEVTLTDTIELNNTISEYIAMLIHESDLPLIFNDEFDPKAMLKALGISVREESDSFIEHIIDYLSVMLKFGDIKVFIFFNLKLYLDENELMILSKFAEQEELILVDIERVNLTCDSPTSLHDILIDEDLCRVL